MNRHILTILFSVFAISLFADSFTCETDFGSIEVPDMPGFSRLPAKELKPFARKLNRDILFALVPSGHKYTGDDPTMISMQPLGDIPLSDDDFQDVYEEFRNNVAPYYNKTLNGIKYGTLVRKKDYFYIMCETRTQDENGNAVLIGNMMGRIRLSLRLFNFVVTFNPAKYNKSSMESQLCAWLEKIADANSPLKLLPRARISEMTVKSLLNEMTATATTRNQPKADGVNLSFRYPESMIYSLSQQAHTVLKFSKRIDGLKFQISVSVFPMQSTDIQIFNRLRSTKDEEKLNQIAEEVTAEITAKYGGEDLSSGFRPVGGQPAFWNAIHNTFNNNGTKMNSLIFTCSCPCQKKVVNFNFMLADTTTDGSNPLDPGLNDILALAPLINKCLDTVVFQ